jgi:hypothetical protein
MPFTPWEIAKEILIQEISEGRVLETMGPKDVYVMKEEYQRVEYKKFRTNLNSLRKAPNKLKNTAAIDIAAVVHDWRLHPINMDNPNFPYPRWDGSDAQRLLKIDVAAEKQKTQKPKDLRLTQ